MYLLHLYEKMHLNLTLDLSRSRSHLPSITIERSLLGSCLYYWDHLSGEIAISLASMMLFVQLNLYFHEVLSSLLALLTLGHVGYVTGIMPWFTLCFVLLCFSCVEFYPYPSGLLHGWAILLLSLHYNDVIMSRMASQITSVSIVCWTVCSGADQRKTSMLHVTGLCAGNSPVTGEFPTQRASNVENISIW